MDFAELQTAKRMYAETHKMSIAESEERLKRFDAVCDQLNEATAWSPLFHNSAIQLMIITKCLNSMVTLPDPEILNDEDFSSISLLSYTMFIDGVRSSLITAVRDACVLLTASGKAAQICQKKGV